MSREAGLELLATAAGMSVTDVEQMNPILYVRHYLNEFPEDAIELLIKLCQMFGPYSYKLMAAQLAGAQLEPILEEPSTPTMSELPTPEKTEEPIPPSEPIPTEEFIAVTDLTVAEEEPETRETNETNETNKTNKTNKTNETNPEPEKPTLQPIRLPPLVRCGCWAW